MDFLLPSKPLVSENLGVTIFCLVANDFMSEAYS